MGFFDKVRASFARFMSGRYGADQLSMALVIAALVISIVGSFTGARMMTMVISDALLIGAFSACSARTGTAGRTRMRCT